MQEETGHTADSVDVLVIGAGLAGLTAARMLANEGVTTVVLEARDRVGGRVLSQRLGNMVVDLGGQFVGPGQTRMMKLLGELELQTMPTWHRGTKQIELNGRRATYGGAIPKLPPLVLLQLQLVLTLLDRHGKQVSPATPWTASRAATWDALSVEAWYSRFVLGKAGRALLNQTIRMTFGAEAREMSLLHLLQYLSGSGGLQHMAAIEGGALQERIVEGAQQLAVRLAAGLGERVVLRAPVRRIEQTGAGVTVRSVRGEWSARYLIVAIPPLLAGRIEYDPGLGTWRDGLTQRAPMPAAIKCIATYERAFWREHGFSGEVIGEDGPLGFVLDNSAPDGAQPALVGFIEGAPAREWGTRPAAERQRGVLADLARFFGADAEQPIAYVDQDWAAERWTGGCSAAVLPPGVLSRFGAALRAPIGRLHWAGSETATEWFGYMEGAIESGQRAAREVLTRL